MIYNIKNEKIDIKRVFKVAKAKKGKPASYKCICEEGSAISGDIQKTLFDETIYDEDKVMISGTNTVTGIKHFFYVNRKNNGTLKFKQYKNNVYKNPTDAKMLNHIVSPGKTRFLISSFARNNGIISELFCGGESVFYGNGIQVAVIVALKICRFTRVVEYPLRGSAGAFVYTIFVSAFTCVGKT